jgi:hypothetical protein
VPARSRLDRQQGLVADVDPRGAVPGLLEDFLHALEVVDQTAAAGVGHRHLDAAQRARRGLGTRLADSQDELGHVGHLGARVPCVARVELDGEVAQVGRERQRVGAGLGQERLAGELAGRLERDARTGLGGRRVTGLGTVSALRRRGRMTANRLDRSVARARWRALDGRTARLGRPDPTKTGP